MIRVCRGTGRKGATKEPRIGIGATEEDRVGGRGGCRSRSHGFRLDAGALFLGRSSVSHRRSTNRTWRTPASGFRTDLREGMHGPSLSAHLTDVDLSHFLAGTSLNPKWPVPGGACADRETAVPVPRRATGWPLRRSSPTSSIFAGFLGDATPDRRVSRRGGPAAATRSRSPATRPPCPLRSRPRARHGRRR